MIRIASVALPKSPMNLARGDEVPQIITRRTRQRPSEFLTSPAKRLLQHYLPEADMTALSATLRCQMKANPSVSGPFVFDRRKARVATAAYDDYSGPTHYLRRQRGPLWCLRLPEPCAGGRRSAQRYGCEQRSRNETSQSSSEKRREIRRRKIPSHTGAISSDGRPKLMGREDPAEQDGSLRPTEMLSC